MNSTLRTLILVTLVGLGAFAGSTVAASDASLTASPETAGETATHTAMVTVGTEVSGPFTGFALDYSEAGVNVSNVSVEDVTIGIDRGDSNSEAAVDEDLTDDIESVNSSNNGEMLMLTLGGSFELSEGDQIVVEIENVENPEAGEYAIGLEINPDGSGGAAEAMLSITDSENGTETTGGENETETGTEMSGETETETEVVDETETEMGDETETERIVSVSDDETVTEGPGFGVVVAVLAMLGAVLVVARRQE